MISLDVGNIHKARQWDLVITGEDIEEDRFRIALQVVSEVTGRSRESRKRKKRPNGGFEGNGENEVALSQIHTNLGIETYHEVSFRSINRWKTFDIINTICNKN